MLFSRFKDSGIIELLVEAGVETEGTAGIAIPGADARQGIR